MKVHVRDRVTAGIAIVLLGGLVLLSFYYSLQVQIQGFAAPKQTQTPDYIAHNIAVTEFAADGTASRRVFADYAEHYADGRMSAIGPRLVTLDPKTAQVRASADSGLSNDSGESFVFTGNVTVTRAGDAQNLPLRFTAPTVTVFPDSSTLETDAPVELTQGSDVTTGVGLSLDNVDRTVRIHSNVHTTTLPRQIR